MRVTTSMTNNATMNAGMSVTGNSLASFLNGEGTDSMAASLGNKHHSTMNVYSKGKYEKLKESADRLEQYADALNATGNKSLFEEAKKSGDPTEVYGEVEKMVSAYNDLLGRMRTDMSTMGRFYYESLKALTADHKDELSALGITMDKNGKLSIDKEKLKSADLSRLESVFGAEGTLTSRLNLIAGKVADSAEASLKSASSQYNAAGNSVDSLIRSYDAKG